MFTNLTLFLKSSIIFLLVLSTLSISFAACTLGYNENDCPIFNTGDITIDVQGSQIENSNLEVYDSTTGNRLLTKNNEIIDSFKYPGVYTANVIPVLNSGEPNEIIEQEFVFDNAQPQMPLVNAIISNEFEVQTQYIGDELIIEDKSGTQIYSQVFDDSTSMIVPQLNYNGYIELSIKRNDLSSQKLRRHYYNEEPALRDTLATINSLNINDIENINSVVGGKTNQRNFYISGSASGDYLRINGKQVIAQQGQFGAFIQLNEGSNTIEVKGTNTNTYQVSYEKKTFDFTQIEVDKLIDTNIATISGKTSSQESFLVYVNGNLYDQITPQNNDFTININNIENSKTFIQLRGENGAYYETTIYKDNEVPTITPYNNEVVSQNNNLVFLIQDDLGVDEDSLQLTNNGNTFSLSDFTRKGDFFALPVTELSNGEYTLEVSDRFDKQATYQGNLVIDTQRPIPQNISVSGTKFTQLGSHLVFSTKEGISLNFFMNQPFAFENIYLDGFDQTDYEIFSDNSVELALMPLKDNGTLELRYIDEDKNSFTQTYTYDVVEPIEFNLESLSSPVISNEGTPHTINGQFSETKYLDKNSFKINGIKPLWFGNNFESFNTESSSIDVKGLDIVSRTLNSQKENTQIYSSQEPINTIDLSASNIFQLKYQTNNPNQLLFASSIDNINQKYSYIQDNQKISTSQQQGLQLISLELQGLSGAKGKVYVPYILDNLPPKLYLRETQNANQIIIDGTSSPVENNFEIDMSYSSCDNSINNPNLRCIEFDKSIDSFQIEVADEAGNTLSSNVQIFELPLLESIQENENEIYFSNNDVQTSESSIYLSGHYTSSKLPESITTSQGDCYYDEQNFFCPYDLSIGENEISLSIDLGDEQIQDSWSITRLQDTTNLELDELTGVQNIYRLGGLVYYFGGDVDLRGENSQDFVTIEINGRPVHKQTQGNQLVIDLGKELSYETQDVEDKVITIQAKTKNSQGEEIKSNKLTIMYAKLNDLLVSILFQ